MMKLTYLIAALAMTIALPNLNASDDQPIKPYTLDYCVFTGDKLGAMGKVKTEVYQGQEMKFCCNDCKKQFDQNPAAGLKKYNAALSTKSSVN